MSPLVCIFAHPDDEAFGPAGAIAKFAAERDVYIICVTNGDASDKLTGRDAYSQKLGKIRSKELQTSANILGVKQVFFLNYNDGTLSNNSYHEIAEKIEEILTKIKPDTLMTFEPNGITGHIDHITTSLITTFVAAKLKFIKKILYSAELKEMMANFPNYYIYVPEGYNKTDIDLTIDVSEFWEVKIEAMKAHKSQKEDAEWLFELYKKFPQEEYFIVKKTN